MGKLYAEGKIQPIVDGPYSLDEIPRMIQEFGDGTHKGKIVISVSGENGINRIENPYFQKSLRFLYP